MCSDATITDAGRAYLALHLIEGLGPILSARLLDPFDTPADVLAAPRSKLERIKGIGPALVERIKSADPAAVTAEVRAAADFGARIVCLADEDYPAILRHIPDAPVCLYVKGDLQPEDALALGIVGTRHNTTYGAEQAERFALMSAETGLTVVSGMAIGIDTAAHRGALRGRGRTIAVLGCGLAGIDRRRDGALADRIAASGALVSEFPMTLQPSRGAFPRRNRIIAGLSLGVLVIEAPPRSGALITARLAIEYNREVFALPGRIDTPQSQGCHRLIRDGSARLVMGIADVLDELGEAGAALRSDAAGSTHRAHASSGAAGEEYVDSGSGEILTGADAGAAASSARSIDRRPPATGRGAAGAPAAAISTAHLTDEEQRIARVIGARPATLEYITATCGLSPSRVAVVLTSLQLKGAITRLPGEKFVVSTAATS